MATKKVDTYFSNKTRITNKRRKQEKWIKNLSEEKKEKIRKANPIGRKRETRG